MTPNPLVEIETVKLRAMLEEHSALVDRWLGLDVERVERQLMLAGCRSKAPAASRTEQNLWIGLAPQRLLTPYIELRFILNRLSLDEGAVVADLGAGYARLAFVLLREFTGVKFVGYEYVGERVQEAKRVLMRVATGSIARDFSTLHADLTAPTFKLPRADAYFIYDFGSPEAINRILFLLKRRSRETSFQLVARGKTTRTLIANYHADWLTSLPVESPTKFASSSPSGVVDCAFEIYRAG